MLCLAPNEKKEETKGQGGLAGETAERPAAVAVAAIRGIQSTGMEVQAVGAGGTIHCTRPVEAIASEIVQSSTIQVARTNKVKRMGIHNSSKGIRSITNILITG